MPRLWPMLLHFKTYCDVGNLKSVRDFIRKILFDKGVSDSEAHLTVLAVDEICSNLMIHSNGCNHEMEINLDLAFFQNQVRITITDSGLSFNYAEHQDISLESLIYNKRKGGLGLLLVKRIMDEVSYESQSGRNCWVLSKKLRVA